MSEQQWTWEPVGDGLLPEQDNIEIDGDTIVVLCDDVDEVACRLWLGPNVKVCRRVPATGVPEEVHSTLLAALYALYHSEARSKKSDLASVKIMVDKALNWLDSQGQEVGE